MWRIFQFLVILTALAAVALVVYAYAGPIFFAEDFEPPVEEIVTPVTLDLN